MLTYVDGLKRAASTTLLQSKASQIRTEDTVSKESYYRQKKRQPQIQYFLEFDPLQTGPMHKPNMLG